MSSPERLAILQKVPKYKTVSPGLLAYTTSSSFSTIGGNLSSGKYVIQSDGASNLSFVSELNRLDTSYLKTSENASLSTNSLFYFDTTSTVSAISIPSFNDNYYYCFQNGAFVKPTYFNNIITSSLLNSIATTNDKGILSTGGTLQCSTSGEQYAVQKDSNDNYILTKIVMSASGLTSLDYKNFDIEFADHNPVSWSRQAFTTKFGGCGTLTANKAYVVNIAVSFSFNDIEGLYTPKQNYFTMLNSAGSTMFTWYFTPNTTQCFAWTGTYTPTTTSVDWRCDLTIPSGCGIDIDFFKITMIQCGY